MIRIQVLRDEIYVALQEQMQRVMQNANDEDEAEIAKQCEAFGVA